MENLPEAGGWMLRVVRRIPGDQSGVDTVLLQLDMDGMGCVEAECKDQKKGGWAVAQRSNRCPLDTYGPSLARYIFPEHMVCSRLF